MQNKMSTEEALTKIEGELKSLSSELAVCKEAKTTGEACEDICDHSEKEGEPFTSSHSEPNAWHKSSGKGGGCIIL